MKKEIKKENNKEGVAKGRKKVLSGTIISTKMQDTVVVLVKRFVKHPKYEKYVTISKKHKADSKGGEYQVGDEVKIEECNPISKDKKFRVIKI
ncbi:MAG: 30S ribosomal protein S17 [Patescibacteria group bacterium]|nr:30S ribosomal protein S17 [Patescibacteria group bacterium]